MQGVLVWSLARELRSHMLHSMAKKEMKRNIFYYQGQRPSINVDTSLSWQELVSWPFLDTGETENCIPWHSTHCLAAALLWKGVWIFGREPVLSITLCCVKSLQLCLTLCNPVDCRPPSFSVHGILQARILEWGCHALLQGIFLTQGSNQCLLHLLHCRWILYHWATSETHQPQWKKVNPLGL